MSDDTRDSDISSRMGTCAVEIERALAAHGMTLDTAVGDDGSVLIVMREIVRP